MNAKFLAVILIFVANFRLCQSRRYDNFSLCVAVPKDQDQLKFLQNLEQQKYLHIMFWKRPCKLYEDVQFIVNPKDWEQFMERAKHFRMSVTVQLQNIQKEFDSQLAHHYRRLQVETFTWQSYHTLDDIYEWLSDMALKYPKIVELVSIGKSFNGKNIYAIAINRPGANESVLVEGGIHGNEWISTEFVTYLINELVNANFLMGAVMSYNWYLVPVLNPDGYEYSQKVDRLWRKNRRSLPIVDAVGVDLNRNFNHSFGKYDSSQNPQDENYCGPTPFSEPEIKAFADYVKEKANNLKYFFSFHSYGQKLIIPYADRVMHMDNYGEMENYGKQAVLKMYHMSGVKYSVGTTYDTLGLRVSGNSASWVKKNYNVKYVFTFFLRDNGSYGYALPSHQILPTCKEAFEGLLEIMTATPRRFRSYDKMYSSHACLHQAGFLTCVLLLLINKLRL